MELKEVKQVIETALRDYYEKGLTNTAATLRSKIYKGLEEINSNMESVVLLRELRDLQNGCPLESLRSEWEGAMCKIDAYLLANETD